MIFFVCLLMYCCLSCVLFLVSRLKWMLVFGLVVENRCMGMLMRLKFNVSEVMEWVEVVMVEFLFLW